MGQQQLLLLVLGIVIVGLAVVAGINAFDENNQKSQKDAILNEGFRIATDIQAHAIKPTQMGGGGGTLPANFADAGIETETVDGSEVYQTPWGTIAYDSGALTLNPTSTDETATINITVDGTPQLAAGGWSEDGGATTPEG